jgi:hypothetical protein
VSRYTRLSKPPAEPKSLPDWLTRAWRAVTELQGLGDTLTADVDALETDLTVAAAIPAWAVITASADQSGIDETASPDLVTAWDTVTAGSTSHGVTVSAGVITLPANTSGYQWQIQADLALTHSAEGSAQFRFYQTPAGANTAIGLTGLALSPTDTHASGRLSAGGVSSLAWVAGAGTVGLRCTSTSSTNTVNLEYEWSRVICREVKA